LPGATLAISTLAAALVTPSAEAFFAIHHCLEIGGAAMSDHCFELSAGFLSYLLANATGGLCKLDSSAKGSLSHPSSLKHNSCGQMQARGLSQNVRRIYYYQNSTCCMVYSNPLLQMIVWTQGLPITTNPYIWQDRYCRYMQVQGQCIFHTRSTIVQVQLPSQNIATSISSQPINIGLAMILDQEWET